MKLNIDENQKDLIFKSLDEKGKLTCVKALALAKKLDIDSTNMMYLTNDLGIKISQCELGVFGNRDTDEVDNELYKKILTYSDKDKRATCTRLWDEAKQSGMKNVRSTVKGSDISVIYCKLGCFEERKSSGRKG